MSQTVQITVGDYAGVVGGGVYQDSALLSQTLTSLSVVGGVKGGHFHRPDRKPAQHRRRFLLSQWYWGLCSHAGLPRPS